MTILSLQSVSKSYRVPKRPKGFWKGLGAVVRGMHETRVALDGVSLSLEEGELVGYIGPNGAGKSTTVKILSGILVPDAGEVKVFGKTPWQHRVEVVRQIGVVFGQRTQLWWDLQVVESFELIREIYGIEGAAYRERLERLVETLDISNILYTPVRMLSLGQRMRCDLAASLLHKPRILFLDEPTIGLDATTKLAVRDFIRELNREEKLTILLTTHDMDDIEALCERVMILNEGKIDFDGKLGVLRKRVTPERRLVVDLVQEGVEMEEAGVEVVRRDGHRVWLKFDPEEVSVCQLIGEIAGKYEVVDLFVENPPIEEMIVKLYGKKS